jgi:hypothetical protein
LLNDKAVVICRQRGHSVSAPHHLAAQSAKRAAARPPAVLKQRSIQRAKSELGEGNLVLERALPRLGLTQPMR